MSLFLTILLGFIPTVGLTALLIGVPYLRMRRKSVESLGEDGPGRGLAVTDRPSPPLERDLQLTTVLAEAGEVLLGYRIGGPWGNSHRPATDVSPSTIETL